MNTELDDLKKAIGTERQEAFAVRAWRAIQKSQEEAFRPGHMIIAAMLCGVIIGASIVALAWLYTSQGLPSILGDGRDGGVNHGQGYPAGDGPDHWSN
jgi:hypothetical protein